MASSVRCSEVNSALGYGVAGIMVWEVWSLFGNDVSYECVFLVAMIVFSQNDLKSDQEIDVFDRRTDQETRRTGTGAALL